MVLIGSCPEGFEAVDDTCWSICPEGKEATRAGYRERCYDICPEGFVRDEFWSCVRSAKIYNVDTYYLYDAECSKNFGACMQLSWGKSVPVCNRLSNFNNVNACWPTEAQRTLHRQKPVQTTGCEKNLERIGNLCYPLCEKGYQTVGDVCTRSCPTGHIQCGTVCTNGGSCEDGKVHKIEAFLSLVEQAAAKTSIDVSFRHFVCN